MHRDRRAVGQRAHARRRRLRAAADGRDGQHQPRFPRRHGREGRRGGDRDPRVERGRRDTRPHRRRRRDGRRRSGARRRRRRKHRDGRDDHHRRGRRRHRLRGRRQARDPRIVDDRLHGRFRPARPGRGRRRHPRPLRRVGETVDGDPASAGSVDVDDRAASARACRHVGEAEGDVGARVPDAQGGIARGGDRRRSADLELAAALEADADAGRVDGRRAVHRDASAGVAGEHHSGAARPGDVDGEVAYRDVRARRADLDRRPAGLHARDVEEIEVDAARRARQLQPEGAAVEREPAGRQPVDPGAVDRAAAGGRVGYRQVGHEVAIRQFHGPGHAGAGRQRGGAHAGGIGLRSGGDDVVAGDVVGRAGGVERPAVAEGGECLVVGQGEAAGGDDGAAVVDEGEDDARIGDGVGDVDGREVVHRRAVAEAGGGGADEDDAPAVEELPAVEGGGPEGVGAAARSQPAHVQRRRHAADGAAAEAEGRICGRRHGAGDPEPYAGVDAADRAAVGDGDPGVARRPGEVDADRAGTGAGDVDRARREGRVAAGEVEPRAARTDAGHRDVFGRHPGVLAGEGQAILAGVRNRDVREPDGRRRVGHRDGRAGGVRDRRVAGDGEAAGDPVEHDARGSAVLADGIERHVCGHRVDVDGRAAVARDRAAGRREGGAGRDAGHADAVAAIVERVEPLEAVGAVARGVEAVAAVAGEGGGPGEGVDAVALDVQPVAAVAAGRQVDAGEAGRGSGEGQPVGGRAGDGEVGEGRAVDARGGDADMAARYRQLPHGAEVGERDDVAAGIRAVHGAVGAAEGEILDRPVREPGGDVSPAADERFAVRERDARRGQVAAAAQRHGEAARARLGDGVVERRRVAEGTEAQRVGAVGEEEAPERLPRVRVEGDAGHDVQRVLGPDMDADVAPDALVQPLAQGGTRGADLPGPGAVVGRRLRRRAERNGQVHAGGELALVAIVVADLAGEGELGSAAEDVADRVFEACLRAGGAASLSRPVGEVIAADVEPQGLAVRKVDRRVHADLALDAPFPVASLGEGGGPFEQLVSDQGKAVAGVVRLGALAERQEGVQVGVEVRRHRLDAEGGAVEPVSADCLRVEIDVAAEHEVGIGDATQHQADILARAAVETVLQARVQDDRRIRALPEGKEAVEQDRAAAVVLGADHGAHLRTPELARAAIGDRTGQRQHDGRQGRGLQKAVGMGKSLAAVFPGRAPRCLEGRSGLRVSRAHCSLSWWVGPEFGNTPNAFVY